MSASREKRNRQNDPSLTEKRQQADQQVAAAQKKTRIYTVIAIVAAVVIAALLIWDSGLFRKNSAAMVINDREYSAAEVSYYYAMAQQQYSYYLPYMGYDSNVSDRKQIYDSSTNQSYYDLFLSDAKASMVRVAALTDAARAEGMELDAVALADLESAMATYKNYATQYGYDLPSYLKLTFGEFMTEEILMDCMKEDALAGQYYNAHADTLSYSDSDLAAYYEEHTTQLDTFRFDLCFINGLLTGEDVTEEQKTAAMELAKSEAGKLLDAKDFSVQASLIANKDDSSFYNEDLHSIGSTISTTYFDWLCDSARKAGDVERFETPSGYYVVRFRDRYLDDETPGEVDVRHILIKANVLQGEDKPTDEDMAAAKAEAQAILDSFLAGEKTGEAFGKLAEEHSSDAGSKTNGGMYSGVTQTTGFFTGFMDWIFEEGRKAGDTGLVENPQSGQQGWHIMYLDKVSQSQWELSASTALKDEDMSVWVADLESGYEAVEANGIKYVG